MRIALIVALAAVVTGPAGAQSAPPDTGVVPVFKEPRHHVALENSLVRLLDVRVGPGDRTLYHTHANRHVAVVIAGARTTEQRYGQPASKADSVADAVGSIFDNTGNALPYTHRVANVDTVSFRYLTAQLLASSGVDAPVLPAASGLRLERETTGARAYVVTLAPGQSTASHRHAQPGLTVQVGPGSIGLEGTAAHSASPQRGAGAWWWRAAGTSHAIHNTGAVPVQIVEIDWR